MRCREEEPGRLWIVSQGAYTYSGPWQTHRPLVAGQMAEQLAVELEVDGDTVKVALGDGKHVWVHWASLRPSERD